MRLKSASGWPVWKIGEIVGRLENSAQLNHLDQWKGCREIEDLQFRNSPAAAGLDRSANGQQPGRSGSQ
ncbi:MAG: hypothetical protein R3C12_16475 [Planctomycetaceae bacterium]